MEFELDNIEKMPLHSFDHADVDFQKQFGHSPSRAYFSPGRVNLIGEYTDFNGGYVLPSAIDRGTYFAAQWNDSGRINVYSDAFNAKVEIPLSEIDREAADHTWGDYVKGALIEFDRHSLLGERGIDIFVTGNLPRNSGLSSSASFTVGIVFLLNDMWKCGLARLEMARYARSVENDFVGLQCGIMDQFAVANGRADHAIFLNCHTLEAEMIPFVLDGYEIVITDSHVPRKLSESSYNQRRVECEAALQILQTEFDVDYLCAASTTEIENCEQLQFTDFDDDGVLDVLTFGDAIAWFEQLDQVSNTAGDANRDLQFNQLDLIQVLRAARYLTGEPATWEAGDWNADGLFDQEDIVAALQTGNYLFGMQAGATLDEQGRQ